MKLNKGSSIVFVRTLQPYKEFVCIPDGPKNRWRIGNFIRLQFICSRNDVAIGSPIPVIFRLS